MSEPHTIRFWKIEMAVGDSYYIVLDGIFTTREGAEAGFPTDGLNYRAQEYQRGHNTDGPERVT